MRKSASLFLFLSTIWVSCVHNSPNLETTNKDVCAAITEKVQQFYAFQYTCVTNSAHHKQITVPNIFSSDEIKEAAFVKLLCTAVPYGVDFQQNIHIDEESITHINDST